MKQGFWVSIPFIVLMFLFIVFFCVTVRDYQGMYAKSTVVEHVSAATDTVTVRDFAGNLWQFKGVEDWEVGDICACVMSDNGTEEIKDDKIISVRYSGFVE